MNISRRLRILTAAGLAAVLTVSLAGCSWPGVDNYPSRQEIEQSILQAPAFPAKGSPSTNSVRVRSVKCVKDTGVKSGSRYRCLVTASDQTRFGAEVVVEPNGRWIMTPGWVDAGRLVITGKAGD